MNLDNFALKGLPYSSNADTVSDTEKRGRGHEAVVNPAISLFISMALISPFSLSGNAERTCERPLQAEDSRELQVHDMLMLFLSPAIDKAVEQYYLQNLKYKPLVYPYEIRIVHVERINGFRGFMFSVTLEVSPVVGPHLSVGKDLITFYVSVGPKLQLIRYRHLEDHKLPPNYEHLLRRKG
ncbi:hypothetical protein J19TS2_23090 [Cohnella xylanilytica]|uniref:DUF3888 domain-containing protein n=1 Tax=Cohnella xylanilytica TaxID=557555 RepID=UPI001B142054|nr:DUF3888 domain-containing protein [Cohnella xylanilytica]GIO12754.1 hypothetical protein J19TS2_23090 [Cohnella xylanilytica]